MEPTERPPSREEIAKREIGHTDMSPTLAKAMVAVFLVTIIAIPTIQSAEELLGRGSSTGASRWPSWCGITSAFDGVRESYRQIDGRRSRRILAANARLLKNIHEYEGRLEDDSFLTRTLLGPTQYWLTRLGNLGNEKAYVGRDRWLFYCPGVDYLTGPGFLESATLIRRASEGNEYNAAPEPDPRPAVLDFQERLTRSGVRLILMPTPDKPMLEPERLSSRYRSAPDVLQNPSYERFIAELKSAGVLVFDAAPVLLERKRQSGQPQFLVTDTHWTPDAMQAVAERLSEFIGENVALPARPRETSRSRPLPVRNLGDVAVMLQLPPDQDLFPSEEVTLRQILQKNCELWRPDSAADILLLGDSFTNIYSMVEMNWGESSGLAEQLSYALGRPVDRIAQNDSGAYATRQTLAQELARGNDRLAGKRVLIWQFAIRELAVGDWKPVAWNQPRSAEQVHSSAPAGPGLDRCLVRGRINAISGAPEPGSVPYRDAILAVHLTEMEPLRGNANGSEALVYLWGMRDNRLTSAARYRPGQSVKLSLTPWTQAQVNFGRFTRVELDDPDFRLIELPTYWADEGP
jgi:alginate O-acetyltransferase complex protein AlgJ